MLFRSVRAGKWERGGSVPLLQMPLKLFLEALQGVHLKGIQQAVAAEYLLPRVVVRSSYSNDAESCFSSFSGSLSLVSSRKWISRRGFLLLSSSSSFSEGLLSPPPPRSDPVQFHGRGQISESKELASSLNKSLSKAVHSAKCWSGESGPEPTQNTRRRSCSWARPRSAAWTWT